MAARDSIFLTSKMPMKTSWVSIRLNMERRELLSGEAARIDNMPPKPKEI